MFGTKMVRFDIGYYSQSHKRVLTQHKYANRINNLVSNGLNVKEKEFLIYAMFTEQASVPGLMNYSQLKRRLRHRKHYLQEYLDTSNGTVRSAIPVGRRDITERVGVSAALLLMNQIFGLHQAVDHNSG